MIKNLKLDYKAASIEAAYIIYIFTKLLLTQGQYFFHGYGALIDAGICIVFLLLLPRISLQDSAIVFAISLVDFFVNESMTCIIIFLIIATAGIVEKAYGDFAKLMLYESVIAQAISIALYIIGISSTSTLRASRYLTTELAILVFYLLTKGSKKLQRLYIIVIGMALTGFLLVATCMCYTLRVENDSLIIRASTPVYILDADDLDYVYSIDYMYLNLTKLEYSEDQQFYLEYDATTDYWQIESVSNGFVFEPVDNTIEDDQQVKAYERDEDEMVKGQYWLLKHVNGKYTFWTIDGTYGLSNLMDHGKKDHGEAHLSSEANEYVIRAASLQENKFYAYLLNYNRQIEFTIYMVTLVLAVGGLCFMYKRRYSL